jgi:hypothetical protein
VETFWHWVALAILVLMGSWVLMIAFGAFLALFSWVMESLGL